MRTGNQSVPAKTRWLVLTDALGSRHHSRPLRDPKPAGSPRPTQGVHGPRHALDRTVGIEVLPQQVAADSDLKQRFEREAKTVAANWFEELTQRVPIN